MPANQSSQSRPAYKRAFLYTLLAAGLLTLSGCGSATGTIDESTPGFFNHYVIYPLSEVIQWLAVQFHDNYGFAIMAVTVLIRVVLFPLMFRQFRSQQNMKAKMAVLQPEMKLLEEKYKGKTSSEDTASKQQEMMALYSKHKVNPLAVGCLPMLIQLPILTGLYSAIRLTPEIASHSFLWFKLGETDMLLPILAAVIYFIQFKVSQIGNDAPQNKQLAFMGYLSPVMMGAFALFAPAAISLYWVTGGLFMIAQTFLLNKLIPRGDKVLPPEGSRAAS